MSGGDSEVTHREVVLAAKVGERGTRERDSAGRHCGKSVDTMILKP